MLLGSHSSASWVRLPRVFAIRSFQSAAPTHSLPPTASSQVHARRASMLRRAVDAHSAEETTHKAIKQQLFPSSSPSDKPKVWQPPRPVNAPQGSTSKKVLGPSPPTALNANGLVKRPLGANTAVKRTSSGLAKSIGGQDDFDFDQALSTPDFEDHAFAPDHRLPQKQAKPQESEVFFDEDDFDSDFDLEVENPAMKSSMKYPTLPPARSHTETTTYLKIQERQLHTSSVRRAESSYESQLFPHEEPPPSSMPFPWSSSPASHKKTPLQKHAFGGFAYTGENITHIQAAHGVQRHNDDSTVENSQRATKRRTLPWLDSGSQQTDEPQTKSLNPTTTSTNTKSRLFNSQDFNPLPKLSESTSYPWNTTASAVKEQQKLLRKTNKKLSNTMEAEEVVKDSAVPVAVKKTRAVARPLLSQEQRHVLNLVVDHGKSVFFTGSAGTGKSVLLREIIAVLRKKYSRETDRVAITASTGLAACNVGGVTLHSFAGIGLGKEGVDELVKRIKKNQKAKHRWMRTKVLVVDEVSMVDGELFDKLEEIARRLRNNGRPFGGIQLVITGDFFQLPPVPDQGSGRLAKFSFDAASWSSAIDHTIGLHHVFRQKDPVFAGMLNEMREGKLSQESITAFRSLSRPLTSMDDLSATELFPTRAEVDAANNARMRQLVGSTMVYDARDGGTIVDKSARDKLLQNCMAPLSLELKKGSQVMLIKNIDEMLVNGSIGKVMGFMSEETFNSYNAKPEGMDDQNTAGEESNRKDYKQQIKLDALRASTGQLWPAVRFVNADGTTRDLLCQREPWKVELPNGEVQASRSQVPLILAWALSIHKAQGQTLERVKVDLGKVFEKGQAYVALSRATSMAGLQVLRFDPNKVLAHERVRTFYASLSRAEEQDREGKNSK